VLLAAVLAVAFAATRVGRTGTAEIELKQTEAQAVLAELQRLDADLGTMVEKYNGARLRLDELESLLTVNSERLRLARRSYAIGTKRLEQRLVELYKSEEPSTLEVILGATSLADLIDRVETVTRVSSQDGQIVEEVRAAKREIAERERRLERARAEQKRVVASIAAQRTEIERSIAEREAYAASIQGQIAELVAEEEARQERLRREAERRLAERRRAAAAAAADAGAEAASSSADGGGGDGGGTPAATDDPAQAVAAEAPAPAAPAPPAPPAPAPRYGGVVDIAMQYLGVPYVWGGASPGGFDCSGFVMYVYAQVGVSLPHHAASQYQLGVPVSRDQLQPGDLVFFNGLGHMGMYIGDGLFVHAPHTGDVVKVSSLGDSWYAGTYVGARRIV
jgi:cell wall-associated NlpC family hydrolase